MGQEMGRADVIFPNHQVMYFRLLRNPSSLYSYRREYKFTYHNRVVSMQTAIIHRDFCHRTEITLTILCVSLAERYTK